MTEQSPILEARGLIVDYPGVRALDGVGFDLNAGEIHAIVGENGAGKSTLINVLSGAATPYAGSITFQGRVIRFGSPRDAERAGVSALHQEVDLIPTLSVAENICLGRQLRRFGFISHRAMRRRADAALGRLGSRLDVTRRLDELAIAVQQLVAIARALDIDARVLILDEPTSSLDAGETQRLFELIRRLRGGGLAVVFISHFLGQVYAVADRITVLRNGRNVGTWTAAELPREQLVEAMTGRTIEPATSRRTLQPRASTAPRLRVERIHRRGSIAPTSLDVQAGETLGVAGLLGSGRSELARLIFGVDRPDGGTGSVDAKPIRVGSIRSTIAAGVAYTPEDRRDALALDLSVRENIVLAMQASRGAFRSLTCREQRSIAHRFIAALGIRAPHADVAVRSLSGGNQQKVLLARWLAMQPRVLILDEPARGVDVGARADIEAMIGRLRTDGAAIMLISSEIDEVVRVCDRVLVLRDRAPVGVIDDVNEGSILSMIAGVEEQT